MLKIAAEPTDVGRETYFVVASQRNSPFARLDRGFPELKAFFYII